MEFRLNDGQVELQETVARFCADRHPLDAVGGREGAPVERTTWSGLADLGVFGLVLPENHGGVGLGAVEAAIVFEQLGSHLAPGPLLWTMLAAPWVDGAVDGSTLVGGVSAADVASGAAIVEHATDLDVVVVLDDASLTVHRMPDLPAPEPLDSLDPLSSVARVRGLTGGDIVGGADDAAALRNLGTVLAAALLVGVGSRAMAVARDYSLERHQFGAPIGQFQAVKHMVADMYVRTLSAQSATYAAAAVLDDPGSDDPWRAPAAAKLLAADAGIANASTAVQVLGGMGFTWDMLPNYLLKRAWVLDHEFGTIEDHEAFLGSLVAAR